jgi:hypothetical protein
MGYRFTYTEKWYDAWFTTLKPSEKLLFIYLYENCDIAGFIEVNPKRWSSDIGITAAQIKGALKGLGRGLIFSAAGDCIYIKTFLKHQKNYPLEPTKNPAHRGIVKRFVIYGYKFDLEATEEKIQEFLEGALKGLNSPIGNGNGNTGNGKEEKGLLRERELKFRTSVDPYIQKYPVPMLEKFCDYWTEKNSTKTRMKFEMERTFEIPKRLATWAAKDKTFDKTSRPDTLTYDQLLERSNAGDKSIWERYQRTIIDGKALWIPKTT